MAENKSNDSIGKTLLVVLVLCLVCSIVVAGSAVGLKSRQQEQRALDKQRNILAVAGLMKQGMSADEVADIFKAHISPRLVDLASGELLDKDPGKFNQAQALKDPQQSLQLEASQDPAGIKRRSNIAEIYLVRDEKQQIQEVQIRIPDQDNTPFNPKLSEPSVAPAVSAKSNYEDELKVEHAAPPVQAKPVAKATEKPVDKPVE